MQKVHICFDLVANFDWVPVWIETVNGHDLVLNGLHVSLYSSFIYGNGNDLFLCAVELNSLFNAFNERIKYIFLLTC